MYLMYQTVLVGCDVLDKTWFMALEKINLPNIIIHDFADFCKQHISEIDWVIPLTLKDYFRMRPIVPSHKILHPAPEIYRLLHNKLVFTRFMMQHFRDMIPKVYYLDNVCIANDITFPIISKPCFSMNGVNMRIYHTAKEFEECIDRKIIQAFVDDPHEYSAFILCVHGIIRNAVVLREKYPQHYIKKTNFSVSCERVHDFNIQIFSPLFRRLRYSGGVDIDFKFDPVTRQISIFEINPRFGGSAFTLGFIHELLCIAPTP